MAWKKKGPKPKKVWAVELVAVTKAAKVLDDLAARGVYIYSVTPVSAAASLAFEERVCIVSCQNVYPKKKAASTAGSEDDQ